jgi:hypothetical protein
MRNSFFSFLRTTRNSVTARKAVMASAPTAVAVYASVVAACQTSPVKPEDAKDLKHHVQGGKSFMNPWDSYKDHNALWFFRNMIGLVIQ